MPALADAVIDDIQVRLEKYLKSTGGYDQLKFLNAGGSAAVYRVTRGAETRAVKVFNPALICGQEDGADKRRLDVQRRLIGHGCATLVETYRVDEAEGTAFVEMEFVPWPQLKDVLANVPDEAIVPLITQLVAAVRFLEDQGIVHRDIKPENIHVSPTFTQLKLLDLGVVRDFGDSATGDAGSTDHGDRRPFLATAQYSSPEYLFRLDEPTAKLWKGLNLYQVGAVLHDLIKKEPLFHYEMSLDNRWLVARAVLAKQPSFADPNLERLSHLKALALRCLVKDLDTRLQIVGWEDFVLEGAGSPVSALKARLARRMTAPSNAAEQATGARLEFERREFVNRFTDRLRTELLQVCGTTLPLSMRAPGPNDPLAYRFTFAVDGSTSIVAVLAFNWQTGIHQRTASITLGAQIASGSGEESSPKQKPLFAVTIQEAEDDAVVALTDALARVVEAGLAMIESAGVENNLGGQELYNSI